ncbi:phosphotransferase [Streptomyces sp. YC419]|uniref:Phosphotransferase n=1 Tax=Streptomyces ureilyticus TaxID=1775131 RepID=A0ABX0DN77_9ACTN|nr:phosphotransferase [Streptomyces ureilyticus]
MAGSEGVVEGPLRGHHHETYVFPLPYPESGDPARWKIREPQPSRDWFDRKCFAGEEQLLMALAGRVRSVPEVIQVESIPLQRFVEGETLGSRFQAGRAIPPHHLGQLMGVFRDLTAIDPESLLVRRRCNPLDRAADGDSSGFLERLVVFSEENVYKRNLWAFGSLFRSLGLDQDCFGCLRKHVSGLQERPFHLLHGDLHRENLIVDPQDRLWVIDWELAMFGDPLYDLATHLYLMRYPHRQAHEVTARWAEAVENVRPGASRGCTADLVRLVTFKWAQSVCTDVIRAVTALQSGLTLPRAVQQVRKVLEAGAEPLGLDTVPTRRQTAAALLWWKRQYAQDA